MLCKSVIFLFGIVALTSAETYLVEDQDGAEFLLVPIPLSRQRRQTTVDIHKNPSGTQVTLGQQGTIFQNDKHQVTGQGYITKQFRPTGPTTVGGGLGYEHLPSGSTLNVAASNTRGLGTDLSATGNANIWRSNDGNARLDAYGSYGRHYGGPWGTGRPNYEGGIQFSGRF